MLMLTALIGWSAGSGCTARLAGPGAGGVATVPAGGDCLEVHLAAVQERQEIGGAAGSGRMQFISDQGRGRASFDFVFLRPDVVRLQFNSPLGPVAAVLHIDRDRYLLADFREGVVIEGVAGEEDLLRLTGLPAEPGTLISLLLGEPVPEEGKVDSVRLDPGTCLPLACELSGTLTPGRPVEVTYVWPGPHPSEERAVRCLSLPQRVVFSGPGPGQNTTIRFRSVSPLTEARSALALDPIDLSGLRRVVLRDVAEGHPPRWLHQE